MKVTVCDVCRETIPGSNYTKRQIDLSPGCVVVVEIRSVEDICYFCSAERTFKAVEKLKAEYDASVEGKRRNAYKEDNT